MRLAFPLDYSWNRRCRRHSGRLGVLAPMIAIDQAGTLSY